MKNTVIYIHGKNGSANECDFYKPLFPEYDVIGIDYKAETPRQARAEFPKLYNDLCENSDKVILIANSIGAYFAMQSLADKRIDRAFFISPIVDMERLILDMMKWSGVTEKALSECGEIETSLGETLSWEYLCYVRKHPIKWDIPTDWTRFGQLYGEWRARHITGRDFMRRMDMSANTFYRRVREYELRHGITEQTSA